MTFDSIRRGTTSTLMSMSSVSANSIAVKNVRLGCRRKIRDTSALLFPSAFANAVRLIFLRSSSSSRAVVTSRTRRRCLMDRRRVGLFSRSASLLMASPLAPGRELRLNLLGLLDLLGRRLAARLVEAVRQNQDLAVSETKEPVARRRDLPHVVHMAQRLEPTAHLPPYLLPQHSLLELVEAREEIAEVRLLEVGEEVVHRLGVVDDDSLDVPVGAMAVDRLEGATSNQLAPSLSTYTLTPSAPRASPRASSPGRSAKGI